MVKLDPQTGGIISEHTTQNIEPYHIVYQGPNIKVQCGVCGLLEDEKLFIQYATYSQKSKN